MEDNKYQEIEDQISKAGALNSLEKMIQDNEIEFEFEKIVYRVRKPTFKENEELNYKRMVKYNSLCQDPNYKLEEDIKADHKKRGIDIDAIDTKTLECQRKENDLLDKLAKLKIGSDIQKFKDDVIAIRQEKYRLMQKKANLLQFSIETQVTDYMNTYLLTLVFEKKVGETWEKVFKTYDDYLASYNTALLVEATNYLTALVYRNALQY